MLQYVASQGSSSIEGRFDTEDEAINFIIKYCCKTCKEDYKRGYTCLFYESDITDEDNIWLVHHILDTPCGAEWYIEKEEA